MLYIRARHYQTACGHSSATLRAGIPKGPSSAIENLNGSYDDKLNLMTAKDVVA